MANAWKLCRSFMYVPGNRVKMIQKIINASPKLSPDIAVFDCEDGVGYEDKLAARENILNAIKSGDMNKCVNSTVCIRINSQKNESLYNDDIEFLWNCLKSSNYKFPQMINLPKVERFSDLSRLNEDLNRGIDEKELKEKIKLSIMIETCMAIVNLPELCKKWILHTDMSCLMPANVVFGSDDYCASLGVTRTQNNTEVLFARQIVANTCRAFDIAPIDMVDIDLKDSEKLSNNCEFGSTLGFLGKQVIHPSQLETVHSAYSPDKNRVEWARSLLAEFDRANQSGAATGVFVFQGQMIDQPSIVQARNILDRDHVIGQKSGQ